jgi:transposase
MLADQADYVLGVDTHRDTHSIAVLAAGTAVVQGQITLAANERGYRRLLRFAHESAPGRRAWAIEGTGSYGAGLTTFLRQQGELVLEVDRPKRPARRDHAKSDELDAIRAAKEALSREHLAQPRSRGEREALRVLLATRESAVRSKRAATSLLKALLVSAPPSLREGLRALPTREQLARAARLRVHPAHNSEQRATTIAVRASARRALALEAEALQLEREIEPIVARLAPALLAEMGVGPIVAAQILGAYSHNGRIRSEAAFAALAGTAPLPASSGQQSATVSTAQATANSTERYTRSCSRACATTPAHAPTPPAAKPKAAAQEKSDAASSATPPDTSTASSTPPSKTPQTAKLDKHRSIAPTRTAHSSPVSSVDAFFNELAGTCRRVDRRRRALRDRRRLSLASQLPG